MTKLTITHKGAMTERITTDTWKDISILASPRTVRQPTNVGFKEEEPVRPHIIQKPSKKKLVTKVSKSNNKTEAIVIEVSTPELEPPSPVKLETQTNKSPDTSSGTDDSP